MKLFRRTSRVLHEYVARALYLQINRHLREGSEAHDNFFDDRIKELDRLCSIPFESAHTLYRGMKVEKALAATFEAAGEYHELGYCSTSFSRKVGSRFCSNSVWLPADKDKVSLLWTITSATHGCVVKDHLRKKEGFAGEREVILPRGTRLEIVKINKVSDELWEIEARAMSLASRAIAA